MKRILRLSAAGVMMSGLAVSLILGASVSAFGAIGDTATSTGGGWGSVSNARMTGTVVGQAAPDECWKAVGDEILNPPRDASGAIVCPSGYQLKVNQAYVWGLTKTGPDASPTLWFGTVANTQCLVIGGYLGLTDPMVNQSSVCELGSSPMVAAGVPPTLGDWRPPQLFYYHPGGATVANAPKSLITSLPNGTPRSPADQAAIMSYLAGSSSLGIPPTVGIRSAGTVSDPLSGQQVVFFSGPAMSTDGGINVLAFEADGTFIGGATLTQYNDIRKWVTVGSNVFAGVGKVAGGGAVVRWVPPVVSGDSYFDFTEVASIPGDVAELTLAGNQLVAGTWPGGAGTMASVFVSPAGTAIADLNGQAWIRAWRASDYEPDMTTAFTYGTGAMSYFGGYVYWGTMHVPGVSFEAFESSHPGRTSQEALSDFVGTYRAISLYRFRLSSSGTAGAVQLLYGDAQLPAFDTVSGSWVMTNNKQSGAAGIYGPSGLGNPFNNYEWSMGQYGGQLYVGTMDWSYLASQAWPAIVQALGLPAGTPNPITSVATYGADLFRFPSTGSGAQTLFTDGVGNYLNYGVRNMLPTSSGLYLGMADPENLATSGAKQGGWELIDLTAAQKAPKGH